MSKGVEAGQVVIITNANAGWVYYSASKLLPRSYEIIASRVKVISARDNHSQESPDDQYHWKKRAFIALKDDKDLKFNDDALINLIVVGDSAFEMEAADALGQSIEKCLVKTVKLCENSTIAGLMK
eukprot:CAMPEP_0170543820 /NCGR_PEP_ID=MMETSP0211-20121228/2798_1 /TAXON_ID=311385 /ORGANISM="Pseudokeronopsis sp., Strain OXSARD2" /LENGTH=125 /DNA_ID=CAMNT_0010847293 /DNA_START=1005 /DNA_END=1382 /DNA_ORIENTATION=-